VYKSEALKMLLTELYIFKDLTVYRLLKKGRQEGSDTSFNIPTDMGRAIKVGNPRSGHGSGKSNTKNLYLKIRLESDSELKILNSSSTFIHWAQGSIR
jgi:hypothetical protein